MKWCLSLDTKGQIWNNNNSFIKTIYLHSNNIWKQKAPLWSWAKAGIIVSDDSNYPLKISPDSELRTWYIFVDFWNLKIETLTLCKPQGSHPLHILVPMTLCLGKSLNSHKRESITRIFENWKDENQPICVKKCSPSPLHTAGPPLSPWSNDQIGWFWKLSLSQMETETFSQSFPMQTPIFCSI